MAVAVVESHLAAPGELDDGMWHVGLALLEPAADAGRMASVMRGLAEDRAHQTVARLGDRARCWRAPLECSEGTNPA
jgi:hypothetical protein